MALKTYILNGKQTVDSSVFIENLKSVLKSQKEFKINIPAGDDIEDEIITNLKRYNVDIIVKDGKGTDNQLKAGALELLLQSAGGYGGWVIADGVVEEITKSSAETFSQGAAELASQSVAEIASQGAGQVLVVVADILATPLGGFVVRAATGAVFGYLGKVIGEMGSRRYILRTLIKSKNTLELHFQPYPAK